MKLIVPYGLSKKYLFRCFKLTRVLRQSQQSPKCTHSAAVPLCFKRHRVRAEDKTGSCFLRACVVTVLLKRVLFPWPLCQTVHPTWLGFFSYTWCSQLTSGHPMTEPQMGSCFYHNVLIQWVQFHANEKISHSKSNTAQHNVLLQL